MNKKQIISISVVLALLLFSVQLFAQKADENVQKSNRLDKVCELLESKGLTKEQKAELLYEKSYIMLTTFQVSSLRIGTESLLEAIELAPDNNEYKDFLCQAYDNLWKGRDFNDGGEFSKDFQALKEKVKIKVEQYRKDWDEKEDEFFAALRVTQGEHSEAELHQATGYWLLGKHNQWERATFHFKKAVEIDPKLYMSWYNLGLIDIDSEEGYNYFKKATEANPKFSTPYYWMAYYRCRYRKDKEAIPLFKKYLEVAEMEKDPEEEGRIKVAKEALSDLLAGKEGESLSNMRKP